MAYAAQYTVPDELNVAVTTSDVLAVCTVRERIAGAGSNALNDTDNSRTAEVREEVPQAGVTQGVAVNGLALPPLEPVTLQWLEVEQGSAQSTHKAVTLLGEHLLTTQVRPEHDLEVKRVAVFMVLMMCDTIELLAHVVVVDATLALNDS